MATTTTGKNVGVASLLLVLSLAVMESILPKAAAFATVRPLGVYQHRPCHRCPFRGIFMQRQLSSSANTNSSNDEKAFTTQDVAMKRQQERTTRYANELPQSVQIHRALGVLSVVTFFMGLAIGVLVVVTIAVSGLLMPSDKGEDDDGDKFDGNNSVTTNRSNTRGGSRTALAALWARSQGHQLGFGPDTKAPELLASALLERPMVVQLAVQLCAGLSRFNYRLTGGRLFEDQVAYLATLCNTGLIAPMNVRTCWLDDCVESFLQWHAEHNDDESTTVNLVILGSGYDSRCYRLTNQRCQCYEVDAPGTMAEKQRAMAALADKSSSTIRTAVQYCPCDFETQDWLAVLRTNHGFDPSYSTLFVWEGVTMYLSKAAVMDSLRKVASISGRSYIAFDYIDQSWAQSPVWQRATKEAGEPFQFALTGTDEAVEELLLTCGLELVEHFNLCRDEQEMTSRYVPRHCNGQPIGKLGNYGGFVLAKCRETSKR